jgi:sporulation protein YlmC with PRC-barrel domain
MRLSDDSLRGRAVISADGHVIGSVTSLYLDDAEWRVESIVVELRKDIAARIGAGRRLFHRASIELPVALIQSVGDAVVLAANVDDLPEAHRAPAAEAPPAP